MRPSSVLLQMTFVGIMSAAIPAGAARQPNGGELLRQIERLGVVGNVLYVAAHPDDENTRLLAWLANEKLVRAGYLSLTRGEGGQNLIGPEREPLLGLIRTQELLAARAVDGAEQMFSRARDFGFSKTPEETLRIWGHDEILADVVWNIRRFRPDVIFTRFSPEDRDTHGHHTSSAMLALEAFKIAGDATKFPEQLKWVQPWQPKRIYWNRGFFGGPPKPGELAAGYVSLEVNSYNAVLGESYGEIAARSRSMHKSQGFGVAPDYAPQSEWFKLLDGSAAKNVFDGIDFSWGRVAGAGKFAELVKRARTEFRVDDPAASIPILLEAYRALDAMPDNPWKEPKRAELKRVLAACAGLFADAFAATHTAIPGGELAVTAGAVNRSKASITLREIRFKDGPTITINKPLEKGQPLVEKATLTLPVETPPSNPYWLVEDPQPGRWTVRDQELIGLPAEPAPLSARFVFAFNGVAIDIDKPIEYKWVDPVAGERRRAVDILPPVTLRPRSPLAVFADAHKKELRVTVKASVGAVEGAVQLAAPAGWSVTPPSLPFKLAHKEDETELTFAVTPPAHLDGGDSASSAATLELTAEIAGARSGRSLQRVEYPHIPIQTVVPPATVKLVRFNLARGKNRLGYVPGAGDEVPESLRQAGYDVTMLSDDAIAESSLAHFDAIITGVRAFNTNTRLFHLLPRLLEYVKNGGTLLVQYNTKNFLSDLEGPLGPYPFEIGRDRVTDETADITSDGKTTILSAPNKLAAADFAHWVQERGLYFATKWDSKYAAPIELHDPGESPKHGALLIAKYGKGTFIYTGLAFFRQLPAGVPGAYRLLANLLAHGR
jgi:LmbE family N-acetylglucosaminyl deacetylase